MTPEDKSCSTCAYHDPNAKTLDQAPSHCWPCASAATRGGALPHWTEKPVSVYPYSTGDRVTATEVRAFHEATPPQVEGGLKFDGDKPSLALLPVESLEEVGKVLTFGAKKYDAHNWRKGFVWSRLLSACLRHVFAFIRGEDKDPETGLSHLAHAACCLLFLISFTKTGAGTDDRAPVTEIGK